MVVHYRLYAMILFYLADIENLDEKKMNRIMMVYGRYSFCQNKGEMKLSVLYQVFIELTFSR